MWINTEKPRITWIANQRPIELGEWVTYTKKINTDKKVKSVVVRFETDSTCALYVNGAFVISGTGRNPERVNCHEVTSLFNEGENVINVTLGSGYFQGRTKNISEFRDFWFSHFAMEFDIEFCDGITLGEIGIVHPLVSKKIDKKAAIVYAELDVNEICKVENAGIHYEEASKYPGMEVDLTFMADSYAPIKAVIDGEKSPLLKKTKVTDIYVDEEGKAITVRLIFSCMDRTLTREEVQAIVDGIISSLAKENINLKA